MKIVKLVKTEHNLIQINNYYSNAPKIRISNNNIIANLHDMNFTNLDVQIITFIAVSTNDRYSDGYRFSFFFDNPISINSIDKNKIASDILAYFNNCEAIMDDSLVVGLHFYRPKECVAELYQQISNFPKFSELINLFRIIDNHYPTSFNFYKVMNAEKKEGHSTILYKYCDFLIKQCKISGSYSVPLGGFKLTEIDRILPFSYILTSVSNVYILEDQYNIGYAYALLLSQ